MRDRELLQRALQSRIRRERLRWTRGFTLTELLAVVAIIAILAAVSAPVFINVMRGRRANSDVLQAAQLFRQAKSRAMGRGSAVAVMYRGADDTLYMHEAIDPAVDNNLPVSTCSGNFSGLAVAENRQISVFRMGRFETDLTTVAAEFPVGNVVTDVDVCFTPRGRTFVRTGGFGGTWQAMAGVVQFSLTRANNQGIVRRVFVPPTGAARTQL